MANKTFITGYPRIGENRELKKALEAFWAGKIPLDELKKTAQNLRKTHWLFQKYEGIDFISANDFSYYDSMLDTCIMLGAIPKRFQAIADKDEQYFAMARGNAASAAMAMMKWFNTNYHYIVPELDVSTEFKADSSKIISEYKEAAELGVEGKINIIGPVTFLGLSKTVDGGNPYDYFKKTLAAYEQVVKDIAKIAKPETIIQFDEPIFVKDPSKQQLDLLKETYTALTAAAGKTKILVTTYFEHSNEATEILGKLPIWGIGLDFVYGSKNIEGLKFIGSKKLVCGIVDGRNIWINDVEKTLSLLGEIVKTIPAENIILSTSCSLLHAPYSLQSENADGSIIKWLAFAKEKVKEVVSISKIFANPTSA
ncbi:MAG: 5-methyltetrahydropteroyltriglutamate--homocysteine S-methyltransferase, partial [Elusimicrobiota bacterium]|nr:5-methyltetrahydropteroyltriglutamate--homocysteine S-methyltransferase [Elusimicrobiota bacterium]